MGRAFQYAGAKSVLMSLWSVSEFASVNIVKSFFQNMKNGKSKSEALRQQGKRSERRVSITHSSGQRSYWWEKRSNVLSNPQLIRLHRTVGSRVAYEELGPTMTPLPVGSTWSSSCPLPAEFQRPSLPSASESGLEV